MYVTIIFYIGGSIIYIYICIYIVNDERLEPSECVIEDVYVTIIIKGVSVSD
jgi:hypothetical protein